MRIRSSDWLSLVIWLLATALLFLSIDWLGSYGGTAVPPAQVRYFFLTVPAAIGFAVGLYLGVVQLRRIRQLGDEKPSMAWFWIALNAASLLIVLGMMLLHVLVVGIMLGPG